MARAFLKIYVALSIIVILINIFMNFTSDGDETLHLLTSDDWLIFMIACGALAISESIEKSRENDKEDNK